MSGSAHIGVDLGASGGRVALGLIRDSRLEIEVVHRFANGPVRSPGDDEERIYWDIKELFTQILSGIRKCAERARGQGITIESVGIDSWAVDYGLLDSDDKLIGVVHHYRDSRTERVMDDLLETHAKLDIYRRTGIQFLPFNTLYQLIAHRAQNPSDLERAKLMLMVPDILNFWLTGVKVCERTNASTTQFYDPMTGEWAAEFSSWTGIDSSVLPTLVDSGEVIGEIKQDMAAYVGLESVKVVAPASHDTAAAVSAVPGVGSDWAYISSGTWSLVGVETNEIYSGPLAFKHNFTNEAGMNGTNRFLKNVMGLWILQECRHAWDNMDFSEIYRLAEESTEFFAMINPDDHRFLAPGLDMPDRVQAACLDTNQVVPKTRGQIARCVLESLAFKYRMVVEEIEEVTGNPIHRLHIVGGGSQIAILNQMTADATGIPITTGPIDASLTGNILTQAEGLGLIGSVERRQIVQNSFDIQTILPRNTPEWDARYEKFKGIL